MAELALTPSLMDSVESHKEEHLALLEALVAIPSHASTPGGTDRVARKLIPILEDLAFTFEVIPQDPIDDALAWTEPILIPGQHQEDLGSTYRATRASPSEQRVLLLGDLDTSYPEEAHRDFPIWTEGDRFYGPGIADMKGGLVVMVAALRALSDLSLEMPVIELVLSADEQAGSLGSSRIIREVASDCAWTLCVECARRGGKLMDARGHIGFGDLTATGVEAHAGSSYDQGVNATDFLARVIPPLNALSRPDDGILVTVTILEAGRRRSVIPDRAWAVLDIRTPSLADWDQTVADIHATVDEYGEGKVAARAYAHRPGVLRSTRSGQLLDLIRGRGEEIDVKIEAFSSAAAGSTAFAAESGSVVMDGMGPIGGGLMTREEHIDIGSIAARAAILAATIADLGQLGERWV